MILLAHLLGDYRRLRVSGDKAFHQVVGMLKDENFVAHNHSHERDESHDGGESQGAVHESQTDERAGEHQSKRRHAHGGDAIFLEVEQEEEEHDNHRDGNAASDLRHGFAVVFYFSAHLGSCALRKFNLVLHDVGDALLHWRGIGASCQLGGDGDAPLAATVHDAGLAPQRAYLGDLSQWHGVVVAIGEDTRQ